MKIFITGIAGFIGYHLARKLFSQGHDVSGLDSFNDYYDPSLKRTRASKLSDLGIEVFDCNLTSSLFLHYNTISQPSLEGVETVIHLAAYAGVRHSMLDPHLYIQNNIIASQNLIDRCEKDGVNRILYASTSCVMAGNPLPWKEDANLGHQLNPYGFTKATTESQFKTSKIKNTTGLRFFTVYGPWGRPDMALFDFTKNIIAGREKAFSLLELKVSMGLGTAPDSEEVRNLFDDQIASKHFNGTSLVGLWSTRASLLGLDLKTTWKRSRG